jgi:enamine deaminase RidA (YjgF/YER057c/UK114 family)
MPEIDVIKASGIYEIFSAHATRHADLVYVSGVVPWDVNKVLVGKDDLEAQTRKTLSNLETVLRAAGTDLQHILKTTLYLTDISKRALADKVRREIFGSRTPASTMVEVSRLAGDGIMIEIDAVAVVPSRG